MPELNFLCQVFKMNQSILAIKELKKNINLKKSKPLSSEMYFTVCHLTFLDLQNWNNFVTKAVLQYIGNYGLCEYI